MHKPIICGTSSACSLLDYAHRSEKVVEGGSESFFKMISHVMTCVRKREREFEREKKVRAGTKVSLSRSHESRAARECRPGTQLPLSHAPPNFCSLQIIESAYRGAILMRTENAHVIVVVAVSVSSSGDDLSYELQSGKLMCVARDVDPAATSGNDDDSCIMPTSLMTRACGGAREILSSGLLSSRLSSQLSSLALALRAPKSISGADAIARLPQLRSCSRAPEGEREGSSGRVRVGQRLSRVSPGLHALLRRASQASSARSLAGSLAGRHIE